MLRLLCTAEFDDGWTERFGKLVEMDRVGFSLDKGRLFLVLSTYRQFLPGVYLHRASE